MRACQYDSDVFISKEMIPCCLQGGGQGVGRRTGFHEAVLGSGMVLGPLVGGILGQAVGGHAPFAACAVVFALAALTQAIIWSRWRRRAGVSVAGGISAGF